MHVYSTYSYGSGKDYQQYKYRILHSFELDPTYVASYHPLFCILWQQNTSKLVYHLCFQSFTTQSLSNLLQSGFYLYHVVQSSGQFILCPDNTWLLGVFHTADCPLLFTVLSSFGQDATLRVSPKRH